MADRLPVIVKLIRNTAHSIQNHMESLGVPKGIQNAILTYMDTFQIEITNSLMGFLERSAGVISLLPSLFVELILGFYLLKDRGILWQGFNQSYTPCLQKTSIANSSRD